MKFFDNYQRTAEGLKDQVLEENRQLKLMLSESQQSFELLKFVHFNKDINLETLNDIIVGCTGCLYSMIFYADKIITNLAETNELYHQVMSQSQTIADARASDHDSAPEKDQEQTPSEHLCILSDIIPDYVVVKYSVTLSQMISDQFNMKYLVMLYPTKFVTEQVLQSVKSFMIVYDVLINIVLTREKMIDLIETDPLTKLLNRRLWNTNLNRIVADKEPFFIIFCDLDYFKDINDTLGHVKGDEVLKLTAAWLKSTFRADDKVFRLGGDEFAIIGKVNPFEVNGLIRKFKKLNAKFSETVKTFLDIELSMSIGVLISQQATNAEKIYLNVDKLLYASKEKGRNTVTIQSDL